MLLRIVIIVFVLSWTSSEACEENKNCVINLEDPAVQTLIKGIETFTNNCMHILLKSDEVEPNKLFSPVATYMGLLVLLFGSNGQTQTELANALGVTNDASIVNGVQNILYGLEVLKKDELFRQSVVMEEMNLGLEVFVQKNHSLLDTFKKLLKNLGGGSAEVDFKNKKQTLEKVKQWVKDQLRDERTGLGLSQTNVDSSDVVMIAVAALFTARWPYYAFFNPLYIEKGIFYNKYGQEMQWDMLKTRASLSYFQNRESPYTAINIACHESFTIMFVLPNKDVDLDEFVNSFTIVDYKKIIDNSPVQQLEIRIPHFSTFNGGSLNEKLKELNIKQLYQGADMSNMIKDGTNLKVLVSHGTVIRLDTNGVSAANIVNSDAEPLAQNLMAQKKLKFFTVDHPFMFFIYHFQSKLIIHAGVITEVQEL